MLIKIDDNYICSVCTPKVFNFIDIKYFVDRYKLYKNFVILLAFMSKRNDNNVILLTKYLTQLTHFYRDLKLLYDRLYPLEDYRYFIKFSKCVINYLLEQCLTTN